MEKGLAQWTCAVLLLLLTEVSHAAAQLTLVKSVTETSYTIPGDQLHYSYLVTNSGDLSLAPPLTVSDDRVAVSCPAVNTVGNLDFLFDPSESITCIATYTITGNDILAASVTNTATASAGGTTSNSDSRTVVLSTAADISVNKSLDFGGPIFAVGQQVYYTIAVANAGPATATNVQITDTPTNLSIDDVYGDCTGFPCTIGSLASGGTAFIHVVATIPSVGTFDNHASASATEADPNLSNNTDNTGNGGTGLNQAEIAVYVFLMNSYPYHEGQSVTFSILVENAGPYAATNIQLTDMPSNLTITSVSGGCSAFPCTIPSMPAEGNALITVTATINSPGAFSNTANIATTDQYDSNPSDNSSVDGETASAAADVSVAKILNTAGPYVSGESVSYTISVHNSGPSPASSVHVTDTPTRLVITGVSGSGCSALPCTLASGLMPGDTQTVMVTATVSASGAFYNSASVSSAEFDTYTTNNTAVSFTGYADDWVFVNGFEDP